MKNFTNNQFSQFKIIIKIKEYLFFLILIFFKIMFQWLMSIPLGFTLQKLKTPVIRNIFSFSFGMIFQFIVIEKWFFVTLINSVINYFVIKIMKKRSAVIVCILQFALLTSCHVNRYIVFFKKKLIFNLIFLKFF